MGIEETEVISEGLSKMENLKSIELDLTYYNLILIHHFI